MRLDARELLVSILTALASFGTRRGHIPDAARGPAVPADSRREASSVGRSAQTRWELMVQRMSIGVRDEVGSRGSAGDSARSDP